VARVKTIRLCLGVLCLKSQIPSTKSQTNLKLQIPNFKPVQSDCFFVWDFEFRSLLFVCFLGFVIWDFKMSMNLQQNKSPLGITKAWFFEPGFFTC
jgi:hypothetical protein